LIAPTGKTVWSLPIGGTETGVVTARLLRKETLYLKYGSVPTVLFALGTILFAGLATIHRQRRFR
jgi:apolipoprotein N-acyltransferase